MKRPLLFILIFLVFGICISYFITNKIFIAILFFIIIAFSYIFYRRYNIKFALFLFSFSIIGFLLIKINSIEIFENKEKIEAIGYINDIAKTSNNTYKFDLNANNINSDRNIKKNIKFKVYVDDIGSLENGDIVKIVGSVYLPKKSDENNSYNQYLNFKADKIDYKLYPKDIEKIGYNKYIYFISSLKERLSSIYDEILPKDKSSILKAMILGDKTELEEDTKDLYKNSGIYHILAISGLHIGILAVALLKLLSLISKKIAPIVTGILLILYCLFTGASPSTTRATIMCIIVLMGYILSKEPDFISSICLSAIILLLYNPYSLFDLGFLYSYICVFSIAFLGGRICTLYKKNIIVESLIISFFISIAIKPITAYYFYNITILDFIANLFILPFMTLVVVLGFLSLLVGIFSIGLAKIMIFLVYIILKYFDIVAMIFKSDILVGKPSPFIIFGVYAMLIFIAYALYEKRFIYKRRKFVPLGIAIFILCISISILGSKNFSIKTIDDTLLGSNRNSSFVVESSNISYRDIVDNVHSRGLNKIDFLFIAYNDKNTMENIFSLIDNMDIKNIFIPCVFELNENYKKLVSICKENDISLYVLEKGDSLSLDNVEFEVLAPDMEKEYSSNKDASLELSIKFNKNTILYEN